MVYDPKTQNSNFDLWACPSKKVVKHDSNEKQGRLFGFKGRFEWYEAILADNRP